MGRIVTIRMITSPPFYDIYIQEDKEEYIYNRYMGWSWRVSDFEPVFPKDSIMYLLEKEKCLK